MYNPITANGWKDAIAIAASRHMPDSPSGSNFKMFIDILLPRPKRLCRKRDDPGEILAPVKPDLDNVLKGAMDALTAIGLWQDDAQVVICAATKWYHAMNDSPGARVTIKELEA